MHDPSDLLAVRVYRGDKQSRVSLLRERGSKRDKGERAATLQDSFLSYTFPPTSSTISNSRMYVPRQEGVCRLWRALL